MMQEFSERPSAQISFADRYALMTTDQAPPDVIARWLLEPLFAAYVRKRRN